MMGSVPPPSDGPMLGLAEAAKACGISVSTVRRKRAVLEKLGATATQSGWRIPIAALVGSGLMPPTTPPPQQPFMQSVMQPQVKGGDTPVATPLEELETLRSQLAAAEQRAAVAEAIAAERERVIEVQATALRMLEAGKAQPEVVNDQPSPVGQIKVSDQHTDQPPRLTLWQRLRGASATR